MENRGSKLARAHPMNITHNLKQNPAAALGKLKKKITPTDTRQLLESHLLIECDKKLVKAEILTSHFPSMYQFLAPLIKSNCL